MNTWTKKIGIWTLSLSMLLLLGACTKKSSSGDSTKANSKTKMKTLRLHIPADVQGFNWYTENSLYQTYVLADVYESLMVRNRDTFKFEPLIAKSFSISEDGLKYTFIIDELAKWHDGTPITSRDVQFTLDLIFDPKVNSGPNKTLWGATFEKKLIIKSDKEFTVVCKKKHFKNMDRVAGISPMPKHLLEGKDPNNGPVVTKTFGSGPYKLAKWENGQRIILEKVPNYWGKHLAYRKGWMNFDKIIYRIIREDKVAVETLKGGYFSQYSFNAENWHKERKNPKIQEKYRTYSYTNKLPSGYSYIGWNNKIAPFNDRNVRVALSHLINKKMINEKFFYGLQVEAFSPINRHTIAAPQDLKGYEFSPSKALELLKTSGWSDTNNDGVLDKNGKKFSFTLMNSNPMAEKYLTVYQEDLKKVGIEMKLKLVEWTSFIKLLDERKFEAVRLGWSASVDPDMQQIWHSESFKGNGSNYIGYSNPKVDDLIMKSHVELDMTKRLEIIKDIARTIAYDSPYTFLFERPVSFNAAKKDFTLPKDFYNYTSSITAPKSWTLTK